MDLNYTPEEEAFRAEVRAFVRSKLPPEIGRKVLEHKRLNKDDHVRWQKILYEQGWIAPGWPVEYGGTGWNAVQKHIFEDECAAVGAPRIIPFGVNMVGPVIIAFGSPAQKQHYLPRILSSEDWWCQGYSEPGAGFGPGLAQDARRAQRRSLHRQRPKDLEHSRPVRRHDLLPGAHCKPGQEAGGHLVPADRHALARRHRAPDHHPGGRARGQRGLVREREGARRQPRRRGRARLDLRQVPAVARAQRDRWRRPLQARAALLETHRLAGAEGRPSADRGSALPRQGRASGDRPDGAGDHRFARGLGRTRRSRLRDRRRRS